MIRSVIAAIKNSYKPLCKQESDNLWCRGKLLISIKRAMNSSRIELLWLVWDQSRSKYYLRTNFQDGIDKPQKCQNVCYHPTNQQQSDFLILVLYDFSAGVPNGEFPEILIAKCRSRFYCTWFICWGEINVSRAWDQVHAGDKALTWETPVKRGRVNRYATYEKYCYCK
jgi:hypothetical protein